MAKTLRQLLEDIKHDLAAYADSRLELLKLRAVEKGVPLGVRATYYAVVIGVGVAALLFLLLVAALLLAMLFAVAVPEVHDAFGALAGGMGVVTALLFLIEAAVLLLRHRIIASLESRWIGRQLDRLEEQEKQAAALKQRTTEQYPEERAHE